MQTRIYAIDRLRAIMMLLGLVIHAALAYAVRGVSGALPLDDPQSSNLFFNIIIAFIHTFRMPVFFMISGFLTAMLYSERGLKKMLLNRVHRLLYPFIIGLVILYPATVISVNYFILVKGATVNPLITALQQFQAEFRFKNIQPGYLWFLYYLILFCAAGCGTTLAASKFFQKGSEKIKGYFKEAFLSKYAPFIFATGTLVCFFKIKLMFISTPQSFTLNTIILAYGYFFVFGWLLYYCKNHLNRFLKNDWLFTCAGMIFFVAACGLLFKRPGIENTRMVYLLMVFSAITIWLLLFGLTGLFFRYFNNQSATVRYIADASYWVYLVHLPVIVFLQALLLRYNFNAFIKFAIVLAGTAILSLCSYNYLVRATLIGKFLNGKKYRRGLPQAPN